MSVHTPEPWNVAEESFDNDGIKESVIRGMDGRAAIAVTLDFGANNPGMREANASRIVACVNACAGISTDYLETLVRNGSCIDAEVKQRIAAYASVRAAAENAAL